MVCVDGGGVCVCVCVRACMYVGVKHMREVVYVGIKHMREVVYVGGQTHAGGGVCGAGGGCTIAIPRC